MLSADWPGWVTLRSPPPLERLSQCAPSAVQVATHRRNGTAGNARDLLVGQSLEVVQHDGDTLRRRQGGDGGGNGIDRQVTLHDTGRLTVLGEHLAEQVEGVG